MAKGIKSSAVGPDRNDGDSDVNENAGASSSPRSALILPLNALAIPLYAPSSREDVQQGGQILFQNFVREEFEQAGLPDPSHAESRLEAGDAPDYVVSPSDDANANSVRFRRAMLSENDESAAIGAGTPEGYKNYTWTRYGRTLRELADQFSVSVQGVEVRRQAQTVDLIDINEQRFWNLLIELFSEGFSTERLLALFCFCTSLLLRSARENGMSLTRNLFTWSLQYIKNRVCQWVYENGGWEKVFGNLYTVLFRIAAVSALLVGIACGIVYIRKNW